MQRKKSSIETDNFDRAILRLVQEDNRLTNEQIAAQVNLSASAVRRRLLALRSSGIIARDVSIVDPGKVGFTVIVMVRCEVESSAAYDRFKDRMKDCPKVTQCYSTSGEHDFIVVAHMLNMSEYNRWIHDFVIGDPDLNRCDTAFVFDTVKFDTAISLED